MNVNRLHRDVEHLRESYPGVAYSAQKRMVIVPAFTFPKGWKPRTAPLALKIPRTYPQQGPDVYIHPDMRFHGDTTVRQYKTNDDGWWKWCIRKLDWDPESHSLYTVVEMMKQSLANPKKRRLARPDGGTPQKSDSQPASGGRRDSEWNSSSRRD